MIVSEPVRRTQDTEQPHPEERAARIEGAVVRRGSQETRVLKPVSPMGTHKASIGATDVRTQEDFR